MIHLVEPSGPASLGYDPEPARRRAEVLLGQSLATIPPRYRWAELGTALLAERLLGSGKTEQFRGLAGLSALLFGSSGSGKTSLACALLRATVDQARAANEARLSRPLGEDERWPRWRPDEREAFRLGAGALFVSALELARAQLQTRLGSETALFRSAVEASYLVLDDVGTDTQLPRATAVRDVIVMRHDRARPTVVTTFLDDAQINEFYGAGFCRRIQDGVAVVALGAT